VDSYSYLDSVGEAVQRVCTVLRAGGAMGGGGRRLVVYVASDEEETAAEITQLLRAAGSATESTALTHTTAATESKALAHTT
jgi:hypothetical protein